MNINIELHEKTYQNGDTPDHSILTLDIYHHKDILNGLRICTGEFSVDEVLTLGNGGLKEVEFNIPGNKGSVIAKIRYGEALQLTEFGRASLKREIRFYPPLIDLDGEVYAVLKEGLHLVLKCPGIIWHDGEWCVPRDNLKYHDGGMWSDTVFADMADTH